MGYLQITSGLHTSVTSLARGMALKSSYMQKCKEIGCDSNHKDLNFDLTKVGFFSAIL